MAHSNAFARIEQTVLGAKQVNDISSIRVFVVSSFTPPSPPTLASIPTKDSTQIRRVMRATDVVFMSDSHHGSVFNLDERQRMR